MSNPKKRAGAPRKAKPKKTQGGMPDLGGMMGGGGGGGGSGGGGGGGDMQGMMGMVQQMQADMQAVQASLADDEVEATVGGGVVTVVATGDQQVKSIEIDPDAVDPDDTEMLQDLVVAGVNEALRLAKEHGEAKMAAVTGGLDLGNLGLG